MSGRCTVPCWAHCLPLQGSTCLACLGRSSHTLFVMLHMWITRAGARSADAAMALDRYGSDTEEGAADVGEPVRPEFPPARLALAPAFPAALGDELGVQLLEVWGFLRSFPQARPPPARQ